MNKEMVENILTGASGDKFFLTTETNVKLKGGKKNPYQDRVTKRTENSLVQIASATSDDETPYVSMIRNRLVEEGKDPESFEVKPRKWGVRIEGTPFIENKGNYYLECIFEKAGNVTYFLDGIDVIDDPNEILGFEEKKPMAAESQGGIENKVQIRTLSLDSVKDIKECQ